MIYTKKTIEDLGIELNIELCADELYCRCGVCGKEIHLDEDMIEAITADQSTLDLFDLGTSFMCDECSKKGTEKHD